jgi:hypothetical protein
LPRNVGYYNQRCVTSQKSKYLIYTAAEVWNNAWNLPSVNQTLGSTNTQPHWAMVLSNSMEKSPSREANRSSS